MGKGKSEGKGTQSGKKRCDFSSIGRERDRHIWMRETKREGDDLGGAFGPHRGGGYDALGVLARSP